MVSPEEYALLPRPPRNANAVATTSATGSYSCGTSTRTGPQLHQQTRTPTPPSTPTCTPPSPALHSTRTGPANASVTPRLSTSSNSCLFRRDGSGNQQELSIVGGDEEGRISTDNRGVTEDVLLVV